MLTRLMLISVLYLISFKSKSQEPKQLNNQDGVFVSYELTRIDSTSKKETYLVVVKAENRNDFDVFYSVPLVKQSNGSYSFGLFENALFAQSSVRNGTGLFGDNINLNANQTKLLTNDNQVLFSIPKKSFVTNEKEFKVKSGVKPIITNTFLLSLKKIENFDIAMNEESINGDYISSCGHVVMTLSITKTATSETNLVQLVNGKQNIWKKNTSNSFQKVGDSNATLSFNKQNNTFTYSTNDGVSCVWTKQ